MGERSIVILPALDCRRSQRVIEFPQARGIPFTRIKLESPEGQSLTKQYNLRASPGILVNGASINPFDVLIGASAV